MELGGNVELGRNNVCFAALREQGRGDGRRGCAVARSGSAILKGPAALQVGKGTDDSVSRLPLSWWYHRRRDALGQDLEGGLSQTRVGYRLSRFETGPNVGDWLVVVQYADMAAYEKALASFAQDPEWHQAVTDISKIAKRISRELVIDLDL